MPNIKSAKKRVRVAKRNALRNKAIKNNLRTTIKKANIAIDENSDNAVEAARLAFKKIDQAASKGVLHKNTAAHRKSAIARKLNNA